MPTQRMVTLHRETIDAMGMTCSQCDVTDMTNRKLFVCYTMRGTKRHPQWAILQQAMP